jgi:hypothetical protein
VKRVPFLLLNLWLDVATEVVLRPLEAADRIAYRWRYRGDR